MRRIIGFALVLVAGLTMGWWWRAHRMKTAASPTLVATGSNSPSPGPITQLTRITPAQRRALVSRIEAAQAARTEDRAASPQPTHETHAPVESKQSHQTVGEAFDAAVAILAECYAENNVPTTGVVVARMMVTSDPDVGTLIDADEILDEQRQPLPKALDECLRATMETLELPPLDPTKPMKRQLSFRIDRPKTGTEQPPGDAAAENAH